MEIRRLTAKKSNAAEIVKGRFVKKPGFESNYVLTKLGRKISRVRVLGTVVDKFLSEDGNYATLTLDDCSETIRCKAFVNTKIFDTVSVGDVVDVVGKVREYNGEIYIAPEIIAQIADKNFETLRMLELAKIYKEQKERIQKLRELKKQTSDVKELKAIAKPFMSGDEVESIIEAEELIGEIKSDEKNEPKEIILKIIENLDKGGGATYADILEKSGLPESALDTTIQELLESGVCFEPKHGKIKRI